jgi:hypothetical protein
MVSVIEEKSEREGRRLQQQQHHYNDYLQSESSAYSLFVLAIRSPQTKQKYLRFGYFLDFAQVETGKGTSIEESCNMLAEVLFCSVTQRGEFLLFPGAGFLSHYQFSHHSIDVTPLLYVETRYIELFYTKSME